VNYFFSRRAFILIATLTSILTIKSFGQDSSISYGKNNIKEKSKLHPTILPSAGYSMHTNWAAAVNVSLGLYTSKKADSTDKISVLSSSITYTLNKQLLFPIQANIWSHGNKYNFNTDIRYLYYPSQNFDLGMSSKPDSRYTLIYHYIKFHQTISKKINTYLFGGTGLYYDNYWKVNIKNSPTSGLTSIEKYGFSDHEKAVGVVAKLMYDSRLNQLNPKNGAFFNVVYRTNFTFLGSDNNWQSIMIDARKYLPFPKNSKNTLAFWNYNTFTISGKPPFLFLPSTGWDDYYNVGRGYIQGRFRGRNLMYFETEYRFNITKNRFIGGVVFANVHSITNSIQLPIYGFAPGYGTGIRIRVNKHNDTNICIDYGFGNNGSKGVIVNLGEVF